MCRSTCAVLGLVALLAPALPDVDAVTFARAFKAGQGDQYKNMQISGSGISFHGAVQERVADGSTRTSLVVTLGALPPDGPIAPILTWDEFTAAAGSHPHR